MYKLLYFFFYVVLAAVAIIVVEVLGTFGNTDNSVRTLYDQSSRPSFYERWLSSPSHDDDYTPPAAHGESSGEHSLFGVVSSLNMLIGSVSVIIIIAAVQFVEYLFQGLHAITHDTPFQQMVATIEKELMIVGCTAFIFKLIINGYQQMPTDWFTALEFADLLVPIFSFAYCGLGFILIVMSIKQCTRWSKAHHLQLLEVLDRYLIEMNSWKHRLTWAGVNQNLSDIEFRVFHQIFCDSFRIQRAAIPFDLYVEKIFEKFVLSIIEIRPIDWFMLAVVILLNLARKELHLDYYKCNHDDHHCDDRGTTILFTIFGAIMLFSTFSFVIISRCLERALMRKKGINHISEYPQYLLHANDLDQAKDAFRLTSQGLKDTAEALKSQANVSESGKTLFSSKLTKSKKLAQKLNLRSSRQIVRRNSIIQAQKEQASKKSLWSQMSSAFSSSLSPSEFNSMRGSYKGVGKSGKNAYQVAPMSTMDDIKAAQELVARQMQEMYNQTEEEVVPRETGIDEGIPVGQSSLPRTVTASYSDVVAFQLSAKRGESPSPPAQLVSQNSDGDGNTLERGGDTPEPTNGAAVGIEGVEGLGFSPVSEDKPIPTVSYNAELAHPHAVQKHLGVKLKPLPGGKNVLSSDAALSQLTSESPVESPTARGGDSPLNMVFPKNRVNQLIASSKNSHGPATPVSYGGFSVATSSDKTVHVHRSRPARGSVQFGDTATVGGAMSGKSSGGMTAEYEDEFNDTVDFGLSNKPMGVAEIESVLAQEPDDLNTIFLFSNPALYFEGVQSLMMLISLYYALFLTNFIVAARTPGWIILVLVPALLSSILFVYVVKSAALLQSVYTLDNECILEVIDQTEGTNHLLTMMRERIIGRLKEMGEPQAELYSLYSDINGGQGDLGRKQFEIFMNALEINFTRRKWQQMFREVDKNFDEKVGFDELFAFLFPDHRLFSVLEKKRMKIIEKRVHQKVKELGEQYLKVGGHKAVSFHASHKLTEPVEDDAEGGFSNLNLKMSTRREKRRRTNAPNVLSPRDESTAA